MLLRRPKMFALSLLPRSVSNAITSMEHVMESGCTFRPLCVVLILPLKQSSFNHCLALHAVRPPRHSAHRNQTVDLISVRSPLYLHNCTQYTIYLPLYMCSIYSLGNCCRPITTVIFTHDFTIQPIKFVGIAHARIQQIHFISISQWAWACEKSSLFPQKKKINI